ncbi:MAG: hypothetical protein COA54_00620 [Thiotrichaceae bacterium]|nr:MAG: hypothetical protein COA54_00620 [Thiotrichaceae bacterium]
MTNFNKLKFGALVYLLTFNSYAQIIFETDFADDSSFYATQQQSSWTAVGANKPTGFDGALIEGNGYIQGMPGEGVGGSVALKFMWDPALGQPVSQLYKHLTGDENTGYDEIYIRYRVRLPNKFKVGIPGNDDVPYWKWGRLWQNTGVAPGQKWTENRADAFYAVWNYGGTDMWGIDAGGTFGANTGANLSQGSAGGQRYSNDFYIGKQDYTMVPGHFRNVGNGDWDFDSTTRLLVNNTSQTWHTFEWRFKLSSSNTSNDGVFQMWVDGVEQVPVKISPGGSAPVLGNLAPTGIPTASHGSGYNFLVMFDNMASWNKNWDDAGVEGGIYVNDVVISTTRIGHDYYVGMPPPKPPSNIQAQ